MEEDIMLQHLTMYLMPSKGIDIEIAQSILMSMRLKDYALSATDLSLYLRCPVSFYYEKILRAPAAKNDSLAFGVAVHFAMEHMVKQMLRRKALDGTVTFPEKDDVLFLFEKSLERNKDAFTEQQFDNRLAEGKEEIAAFYDAFLPTLHGDMYAEQRVGPILVNDVPIKGNIDLIKMEDGEAIVYDYKTGKSDKDKIRKATIPANPDDEKNLYGGDYWRQMLFYKLLLDNYQAIDGRTFNMQKGVFKYVRPDKNGEFQDAEIMIFDKDKEFMKNLIKEVYGKIQRHEFQHGCGEDNCQWCTFVKRYDLNAVTDTIANPQL